MLQPEIKPIAIIGGARPNFMKIVPIVRVLQERDIPFYVVNTGQHFSKEMSQAFFLEFNLPIDIELEPNSQDAAQQQHDIERGLESIFQQRPPSLVLVVGDVNSTRIAAEVAHELAVPVAHVEAGLRSYNSAMPEEHNRIVTDRLSSLLLPPSQDAMVNLEKEGLTSNVHVVGNIMIDLLKSHNVAVKNTTDQFYFATMHRAENVDNKEILGEIISALEEISKDAPVLLPIHPRTKKRAEEFGLFERLQNACVLLPSLSYLESIYYQKNAKAVLTDSGGIQEETSVLGTPCITMRTETERPITVERGTNVVAGVTRESILNAWKKCTFEKKPSEIPLWDGKTAERIVDVVTDFLIV